MKWLKKLTQGEHVHVTSHDGIRHADDQACVALLKLATSGGMTYTPTGRTQESQKKLYLYDLVFDIGGEYDPDLGRFDHHQWGWCTPDTLAECDVKPERPSNGYSAYAPHVPMASCGLFWQSTQELVPMIMRALGVDASLITDGMVGRLHRKFWLECLSGIDARDNGVPLPLLQEGGAWSLPQQALFSLGLVELGRMSNPTWREPERSLDEEFLSGGVELFYQVFRRWWHRVLAGELAGPIVLQHYEIRQNRLVILPHFVPWVRILQKRDDVDFVIFPQNGQHFLQCVPPKDGETTEQRVPLPKEWADVGQDREALKRVTGVEDAVFCHANRWICAADSMAGAIGLHRAATKNERKNETGHNFG